MTVIQQIFYIIRSARVISDDFQRKINLCPDMTEILEFEHFNFLRFPTLNVNFSAENYDRVKLITHL